MLKLLAIILILILIAAVFIVSYVILCFALKPKLQTVEYSMSREKGWNLWGDYDNYSKEHFIIKSFDDYELHSVLLKNEGNKFVIITHGHTATRCGSVKYADMFYKLGFNVLIYDLRHHGENKRCFCSMGKNESRDIIAVADYLTERFGNDIQIGLHGESLGAASSIMALGMSSRFVFCIEDCGFYDLTALLTYHMKHTCHLPMFFLKTAGILSRIIYGLKFKEVSPIEALKENKTPVLFIHGIDDDYIPCDMGKKMYEACSAEKQIHLFEGANHAQSFKTNPEKYYKVVTEFLESINMIDSTRVEDHI